MLVRCPGPDQRAYARLEPAVDRRSPRRIASLVRGLQHLRALGTPRLAVVRMVCVRQGEQAKGTNGERQPACLWRLGVTQVHNSPTGLDLPALPRHVPGGGLDMADRVKALLVLVQPRPQEVHEFHAPQCALSHPWKGNAVAIEFRASAGATTQSGPTVITIPR